MSDWYGTESTAASIKAGLDIEMPGPSKARGQKLMKEVNCGEVSTEVLDERVLGILKIVQRTREVHSLDSADEQIGLDEATNVLIRKIASESIVLLKNERRVLPIDIEKAPKIAIIGEPAVTYCGGGGSASGLPQYFKKPLDSIKEVHPDSAQVVFSPGVTLHRCIPMASPAVLTCKDGKPGVEIVYYANSPSGGLQKVHTESKPVPIVFLLGHHPQDLDEKAGFTYEMAATLTPRTTGSHTVAVLATGAFKLFVDDKEMLSQEEPVMSVEDFLFVPQNLEKRCSVPMQANKPYSVRLITQSRRELNIDEPTPHSSKLCFLEEFSDNTTIKAAGIVAAESDISMVFAGRNNEWEQEGSDLEDILLPKRQTDLIKHVASKSKKTIVVLFGGNPFDVRDWIDDVDAVLFAQFPGQEGGEAIKDILIGKVCPSGKLPMSWPRSLDTVPSNDNFPCSMGPNGPVVKYAEGLRVGYRHFWSQDTGSESSALWDFGYGLSYTTFAMEWLQVTESAVPEGEVLLTAELSVQNTGPVAGAEVIQVYVQDMQASVWRPFKELKGFEKVWLQPGEKRVIQVPMLRKYALSFWDEDQQRWTAEKGEFRVHVGELTANYMLGEGFSWTGV